jgi:hypothetical protein
MESKLSKTEELLKGIDLRTGDQSTGSVLVCLSGFLFEENDPRTHTKLIEQPKPFRFVCFVDRLTTFRSRHRTSLAGPYQSLAGPLLTASLSLLPLVKKCKQILFHHAARGFEFAGDAAIEEVSITT